MVIAHQSWGKHPATTMILFMEPISEEEKRREAEFGALCRQISLEDPGYWDRLADRALAEFKAEDGGVPMEKLFEEQGD
jgi:hypothetical protein